MGDAERDRALDELREHHIAGRLDYTDFNDRAGLALSASTRGDLSRLLIDLPDLDSKRGSRLRETQRVSRSRRLALAAALALSVLLSLGAVTSALVSTEEAPIQCSPSEVAVGQECISLDAP